MPTLDSTLLIPSYVTFSVVGEDTFLLNTRSNQYFVLEEVGTRLWVLLKEGQSLKDAYQILLTEYDVPPSQLEQDILELINQLTEKNLLELA